MHFYNGYSALKHACRLVGGENIGGRSAARYLAYGVIANAEIFNEDFSFSSVVKFQSSRLPRLHGMKSLQLYRPRKS